MAAVSRTGRFYWENDEGRRYYQEEHLGSGAYGQVFKVTHDGGQIFALKTIVLNDDTWRSAQTEAQLCMSIDHPHVLRVHDAFRFGSNACIVSDFCDFGSLRKRIENSDYTLKDVCGWSRMMMSGLKMLHSQKIMHRDIKPDNLLLRSQYGRLVLVIADLGIASFRSSGLAYTGIGSRHFMAPEVSSYPYTFSADIFSAGVTIYALLVCHPAPAPSPSPHSTFARAGPYDVVSLLTAQSLFPQSHFLRSIATLVAQAMNPLPNPRPQARVLYQSFNTLVQFFCEV